MAIKVLVVDDEPDVAVIFRQKFRKRVAAGELEFSFAENGRLALDGLQADPEISLVFTDIRMPTMDGLTFLKEMRALDRQVLLPLVVSAYDDMPNIREAMRQGAWDFVTKPIDLDDLEHVLNQAVAEIGQKLEGIAATNRLAAAEQDRLMALRSKQVQQEFFENITHEFRTPLTLLLAPLESALGLSSEPLVQAHLQQAKKSGFILMDLVNQLLEFAKVDARKVQADLKATDLTALIDGLAAAFAPLAHQRQITFEVNNTPGCIGITDQRMLGRILLNLLSNAFKFTRKEGQLRLAMTRQSDGILLEVQDNGPGMPMSETENTYSRFQPSQPGDNSLYGGSGLGLSICKTLVELLNGEITLQTKEGLGTSFRIVLPMTLLEAASLNKDETELSISVSDAMSSYPSAATEQDDGGDKPILLIAEDHPDMRHYLVEVLQDAFHVVLAENGRLAWEKAQAEIPDIVLTDWMMPEMDGLQLLEYLRHDRDTHHIPIVMLTAKADWEHKIKGLTTGAEAFLPKPFHPEELKAVLHNLLQQRERQRERFRLEMLRPDKVGSTSMEDQFIVDVKRVMELHLMDEQFGVESMADALAMSRRTLMRKLTAVTGQAPVKFIRGYRLERAQQMLRDHSAPIWEIAVKTGFGSASYFTKCFKDHFGMSPKEATHLQ
jgi:YesN/AraC family two-component response regulator/two-component sensor histidine kinase